MQFRVMNVGQLNTNAFRLQPAHLSAFQADTLPAGYVPWAYFHGAPKHLEVVYAPLQHAHLAPSTFAMQAYDQTISKARRRRCQAELGVMVLKNPAWTQIAVDQVSYGVRHFINRLVEDDPTMRGRILDTISRYSFSDGQGFGLISSMPPQNMPENLRWQFMMNQLKPGNQDVAKTLAIHDAVGRKMLDDPHFWVATSADIKWEFMATKIRYGQRKQAVRQAWYDGPTRGRTKVRGVKATSVASVLPANGMNGALPGAKMAKRKRGIDQNLRDPARTRSTEGDQYYDEVDRLNLLFGAGISGSTGTLLAAAAAFGNLTRHERMKQYTLAIVGYLVGGGMHTYHETMAVATKADVAYTPGAYETSMPDTFKQSDLFKRWRHDYYDIVVLGDQHNRFVGNFVPSANNPLLKMPGPQPRPKPAKMAF